MEGSTATTVEELMAEDAAYKKSLKYKFKKLFDGADEVEEIVKESTPELRPEAEIINTNTETEIENNAQE